MNETNNSPSSISSPLPLSAISVLIDELRSPDLPTRLHAFHSIGSISSALGPLRSREELIPYLSEFIDDDDEILLVLSSQLANLVDLIGGANFAHVLLPPLEQLCMTEESSVRVSSVDSVVKIMALMTEIQIENFIVPMIRKLSTNEWFTAKQSACALIPNIYTKVNANTKKEMRQIFTKLCSDETPMVKRAACENFGLLCLSVEYSAVKAELFPIFLKLVKDDQDSVRLLTVNAAVSVAKTLKPADHVTKLLPVIFQLCADKSWRVRYMAADKFVDLCNAMIASGSEVKSDEFVDAFVRLMADEEAEVRTAAAGKVGELSNLVGQQQTLRKLISPCKSLVRDPNQYVRAALAAVLTSLAKTLNKKETVEHLIPLFLQLLKDANSEVRLKLIERLDSISDSFSSSDSLASALLPAICELAADVKWRVRLEIIQHIPTLATQLGSAFFDAKLSDLSMSWLGDSVFSIRQAATKNLSALVKVFGADWAEFSIMPKVLALSEHRSYLYRLTSISCMSDMSAMMKEATVNEKFLPALIKLCGDPVPNVRFAALKAIAEIKENGKNLNPNVGDLLAIVARLEQDSDTDVKYYAQVCKNSLTKSGAR